jgi:rubredoxin
MANYLRTCAKCSYSWEVPRDMKKGGRTSFFAFGSLPRGGGGGQVLYSASAGPSQSDIAQGEEFEAAMESYRTCPQCGSQDFRDERIKRKRSST